MPARTPAAATTSRRTIIRAGAALAATTGAVGLADSPAHARGHDAGPGRSRRGTTYYVAADGDDSASGTSPHRPWRSLQKVSSTVLEPGDEVRFRSGDAFTGVLALQGSGTARQPIRVGRYGHGPRPRLDGSGAVPATVHITASSHLRLEDLEITDHADSPAYRSGVLIDAPEDGLQDITLRSLTIRDITGAPYTGQQDFPDAACGGISVTGSGEKVVDGLRIEDVRITDVDDHGIRTTASSQTARGTDYVFRGVDVVNAGGNGIVIANVTGGLVEDCTVRDSGARSTACAGIWPVYSDDVTIQHNGVWSQTTLANDGFSFNCDWQNAGAVFQYNFSHGSARGFFQSFFQSTAVVRFNVSQADASGIALYGASDLQIYHNTIVLAEGTDGAMVRSFENQGSTPSGNVLTNNILVHNGSGDYESLGVSWDHNLFHGHHPASEPTEGDPVIADPLLVSPDEGDSQDAEGFRLRRGSPALHAGARIPDDGGRDFFGERTGGRRAPNIGASAGRGVRGHEHGNGRS